MAAYCCFLCTSEEIPSTDSDGAVVFLHLYTRKNNGGRTYHKAAIGQLFLHQHPTYCIHHTIAMEMYGLLTTSMGCFPLQ